MDNYQVNRMDAKQGLSNQDTKLTLSVYPNGITKHGNPRFSFLFGFFNDTQIENLLISWDAIIEFGEIIEKSLKKIELEVEGGPGRWRPANLNYSFDDITIERWRNLLPEKGEQSLLPPNSSGPPENPFISDSFKDYVQNLKFASFYFNPNPASAWVAGLGFSGDVRKEYQEFKKFQAERESLWRRVNIAGRKNAAKNSDKSLNLTKGSLNEVLATIYENPGLCAPFGLRADFEISENIEDYWPSGDAAEAILNRSLRLLVRIDDETLAMAWKHAAEPYESFVAAADLTSSSIGTKYYHGYSNFGFVNSDNNDWYFDSVHPDHRLQSLYENVEKSYANMTNGPGLPDQDFARVATTQGLYILKTESRINSQLREFMARANSFEVSELGLRPIAAEITNANEVKKIASLTTRRSKYAHKEFNNIELLEEGWVISGGKQKVANSDRFDTDDSSFDTQILLSWDGNNLGVSTAPADDHDNETGDEEEGGGVDGITRRFVDAGYEFTHQAVQGTNIFLLEGRRYGFLLNRVQRNSYVIPTESEHEHEISVRTLLELQETKPEVLAKHWHKMPEGEVFSLADPVYPPNSIPEYQLKAGDSALNTESAYHLVATRDGEVGVASERWLTPPAIGEQFAKWLGLFEKENLDPNNLGKHVYLRRARRLSARAARNVPITTISDRIKYLPDVRAVTFAMKPLDWATANWFKEKLKLNPGQPFAIGDFQYQDKHDYFKELRAWKLILNGIKPGESEKIAIYKPSRTVVINAELGRKLKIGIGFLISGTDAHGPRISAMQLSYFKYFGVPMENYWAPMKTFDFTVATTKPTIAASFSKEDPEQFRELNDNPSMSFLSFAIDKKIHDLTTRRLVINSTTSTVVDDPAKIPSKPSSTKIFEPLENEFAVEEVFGITESKMEIVYPNDFSLKFTVSENISKLESGTELVHFAFGDNKSVSVVVAEKDKISFLLNGAVMSGLQGFPIVTGIMKLHFCYFFCSEERDGCTSGAPHCSISVSNAAGTKKNTYLLNEVGLPSDDLSERNVKLGKDISFLTHIKNLSVARSSNYFTYTDEGSTKHLKKSLVLQTDGGKFHEVFPNIDDQGYFIHPDESVLAVDVRNATLPSVPEFTLTPLLYRESQNDSTRQQFLVMVEIDRASEDSGIDWKFGLVLGESEGPGGLPIVTEETCAVGRDITTYGANFENEPLDDYLILDRNVLERDYPFLLKYFESSENTIENIRGKNYRVLGLTPHYLTSKDKYIVIIALKFPGGKDKAELKYSPFIRIVGSRFQRASVSNRLLSDFSIPKYFNVQSERQVKIKQIGDRRFSVEITPAAVKIGRLLTSNESVNSRTTYTLCVREKDDSGFLGPIVASSFSFAMDSNEWVAGKAHSLTLESAGSHKVKIWAKGLNPRAHVICVYEFEGFSRLPTSNKSSEVGDPFSNSDMRLLFAEEFPMSVFETPTGDVKEHKDRD